MNINNPLKGILRDEIMEIIKKEPEEDREQLMVKERYKLIYNLTRLKPLDLSKERFYKILEEHYTYRVFFHGSFVHHILRTFYSDDAGKINTILTDKLSLLCISNDNTICIHNSISLFNLYSSSNTFKDRLKEYYLEFIHRPMEEEDYTYTKIINNRTKFQWDILRNKCCLNKKIKEESSIFLKIEDIPIETNIRFIEE
jgi:hypothetical protein